MLHEIQKHIEEVSAVSGKLDKQTLVKSLLEKVKYSEEVLNYALSPFITFGVASGVQPPQVSTTLQQVTDEESTVFFNLLTDLAGRTVSGNDAIDRIYETYARLSYSTALLLYNVIQKDLRAGFGISTVNKAAGKKIIHEFNTMLAHKYDPKRITKWPVYVEPKLDGMRCIAKVTKGGVEFVSRNGKAITSIPHLEKEVRAMLDQNFKSYDTLFVDGELTSGDNFNISISALRKKDAIAKEAIFHIFDILTEEEFTGSSTATQSDRVLDLKGISEDFDSLQVVAYDMAYDDQQVWAMYHLQREKGMEGIIVKDPNGIYEPKRSYAWMKIKDQNDADLRVVGVFEGQGKYVGQLGGLIVDHKGVEVRVGSGLSDADREELWHRQDELIGQIAEVQYHEVTPDGSLRHPRFVRFRDDK